LSQWNAAKQAEFKVRETYDPQSVGTGTPAASKALVT
jgi:hypothetical protein